MSSAPDNKPDDDDTTASETSENDASQLSELLEYVKQSRGFDFTGYKRASLMRRFKKRMHAIRIDSFDEYRKYLDANPDEFVQLFNTVLINVTSFFRDGGPWDTVTSIIVPTLMDRKAADPPIRIWSAGCATGEEAYTIAMIFSEVMGAEQFRARVKIYATDVDDDALARARAGTFSQRDVEGLPLDLLKKYFDRTDEHFIFRKDLRRTIIFGRNDLVQDAPISRIDLLVSRNTLMYFDPATQSRILTRFHFALSDGGYLVLGRAETLLTHTNTFAPIDLKNRIFMKVPRNLGRDRFALPADPGAGSQPKEATLHARLRASAFDTAPVAQIIIERPGTLISANERARAMFGISAVDIGRPIQDLEISYRPLELRSLVDQAYAERRTISRSDVAWTDTLGDVHWLSVQIVPVFESGMTPAGVSITFSDITGYRRLQEELEASNHELETAFEELQSTNEELETTNEELQSTIEELETTNEELQSTNEELETMNEELQSTNEELNAINDHARRRSDELNETNAFLDALIASLHGSVIVVDPEMHVTAWNDRSQDLWGLRSGEVVGTNLLNLDIGLPVGELRPAIRAVLAGSRMAQQAVNAITRRGRNVVCDVTISPLLASPTDGERAIRGAIIVANPSDDSAGAS